MLRHSVVKITSENHVYRYNEPWNAPRQSKVKGTGFVIEINGELRILTNAHLVSAPAYIKVEKDQRGSRLPNAIAEVEYLDHECDLAVLKVSQKSDIAQKFFADLQPMRLAPNPAVVNSEILTAGYPEMGSDTFNQLSVDHGKVTGVIFDTYAHANARNLVARIDVPVNPGNSGGPVLQRQDTPVQAGEAISYELVGVVFQRYQERNAMGFMIPLSVVKHFLLDVARATVGGLNYSGFPDLGVTFASINDRVAKEYFFDGFSQYHHGLQVVHISPLSDARNLLRKNDAVVSFEIDGVLYPILSGGMVKIDADTYVAADFLIRKSHIHDTIGVNFIREKQMHHAEIFLTKNSRQIRLVPERLYGEPPTFYIYGSYLFQPLSLNYLEAWGDNWRAKAPGSLRQLYDNDRYNMKNSSKHEVVVLNRVLKSRDFYDTDYQDVIIDEIDGTKILSMRHLITVLEQGNSHFATRVVTVQPPEGGQRTILLSPLSKDLHAAVLRMYSISRARSQDLLPPSVPKAGFSEDL